jgi:ABC-2 type transport system permease protein
MLALLQGEWLKIRRQKGIYLVFSTLFLLTIAHGIYQAFQQPDPVPESWQPALQSELAQLQEKQPELNPGTLMYEINRDKILLYQYQLEHQIPPDKGQSAWKFLSSNKMLLTISGLYLITMSVYIVASEYQQGTVKFLFLKPVSRLSVMAAKWCIVSLLLVLIVSFLMIVSFLTGLILFGNSGPAETLVVVGDEVVVQNVAFAALRYYLFTGIGIGVFCAGAFTLACLLRSVAVVTAISLFLFYSGELATRLLAARFNGAKYILFANTDLNVYFEGNAFTDGMSMPFSITILLVYLLFFAVVVFKSVHNKDVPLS